MHVVSRCPDSMNNFDDPCPQQLGGRILITEAAATMQPRAISTHFECSLRQRLVPGMLVPLPLPHVLDLYALGVARLVQCEGG